MTQRNGCFKFDFVYFISSTSSARFCRFLNYSWRHLWHFDSFKLFSKMRNAWLWAHFFAFEMNTCTVDDLSLFITSWTDLHMPKHLNGEKKSNFSLMLYLLQLQFVVWVVWHVQHAFRNLNIDIWFELQLIFNLLDQQKIESQLKIFIFHWMRQSIWGKKCLSEIEIVLS